MSDEFKIRLDSDETEPKIVASAKESVNPDAEIFEIQPEESFTEITNLSNNYFKSAESISDCVAQIQTNTVQAKRSSKQGALYARLWVYILATLVSFGICILTSRSQLGITIFAAVQAAAIFTIPQWYQTKFSAFRTAMLVFLMLLALFPLIGGNMYFRGWNCLVAAGVTIWIVLETVGKLPLDESFLNCISNTFSLFFSAIGRLFRPFQWLKQNTNGERGIVRRVLIGLLISLPAAIILIWMLSTADSVFRWYLNDLLQWVAKLFTLTGILKTIFSIIVALILSQLLHTALCVAPSQSHVQTRQKDGGDILILGIVFGMICLIYTVFIVIQFHYLFAQAELPLGLTYSEYARRGFFSLVVLSAINVCSILCVCRSMRNTLSGKSASTVVMKIILWYLCGATAVLLASAAYRMFLYDHAYGYTRQRLFVYLFLAFEVVILLLTILRIINVRWKLARCYIALFLCFYLALNLPGIDTLIAAKNIDRFEAGMNLDVEYLTSLSHDAAPQIARLKDVQETKDENDRDIREWVENYFEKLRNESSFYRYDWRSYSILKMKAYQIAENF